MKFSLTPYNKVQQMNQSLFSTNAHLVCCLLFFNEYLNPRIRINKIVKEQRQLLVLQGYPQVKTLSCLHRYLRDLSLQ